MSKMSELMNEYSNANEIAELKRQSIVAGQNEMDALNILQDKNRILNEKFHAFEYFTKCRESLNEEQIRQGNIAYLEQRAAFDAYQTAYQNYNVISAESARIRQQLKEALKK